MSVKRSVNVVDQLRVDTNDLRSIESSVRNDFDELLRAFVTGQGSDQAYILRGFELSMGASIGSGASSLALVVADSALFNGTATVGGTFYVVPTSQPSEILNSVVNSKVYGSFTPNSLNYIALDLSRAPATSTSAPRAIWDPVNKTEFSKTLPLAELLDYKINITTGTFASNSVPVAVVLTDANNSVIEITDKRPQLFRLGKSGLNANNSAYSYGWSNDTEGRSENPSTSTSSSLNPFKGGDKQIKNLKEWMDAVMTEIKLIKGSSFWYTNGSTLVSDLNLTNIFSDALATVMTGKGKFIHSDTTAGLLEWTSDIYIKNTMSNLDITIQTGSVTLLENEVAYIQLQRNVIFQPANVFTFTSGSNLVTAVTNVTGIVAGDYVKSEFASQSFWHKVQSVTGNQITLTSAYTGSPAIGNAVKVTGTYSTVSKADRANVPNNGNIFWLAFRNDNAISSTPIISAARVNNIATYTVSGSHEVVVGQNVKIVGSSDPTFDGVHTVTATTLTSFSIENEGPDATSTGGMASSAATIYIREMGEIQEGEQVQISDETVLNILEYIGAPTESSISPIYLKQNYLTNGNSITLAASKVDDVLLNHQEDRSSFLRSDELVEFTGGAISFISDIVLEVLNTKTGTQISHVIEVSNSPIAIDNGESIWCSVDRANGGVVTINRSTITPIPSVSYADKDVYVLFTRIDSSTDSFLHIPLHKQVISADRPTRLGASGGGGNGFVKVDYLDPVSTSLPTGTTVTIDGQLGVDGDLVLFTNLLVNNNRVYKLGGVGTSLTWTMQKSFDFKFAPTDGDAVIVKKGDAFREQIAIFDGTNFLVNDVVRQFDGVSGNFYEVSSIKTTSLLNDNTGTIFSVSALGSENMVIDYSILRGGAKETGQLFITQDGVNAGISRANSYLGDPEVTLSAAVNAGNIELNYTTSNLGPDATIKYTVKRWSDAAGGPTGIPSYSGASAGGGSAAGTNSDIQFNTGGSLAADSRFQWNAIDGNLELGNLQVSALSSSAIINDNQIIPQTIVQINKTLSPHCVLEYSVVKSGIFRTGRIMIASNGSSAAFNDDYVETGVSGVTFNVSVVGSNIEVAYQSTNTGSTGSFKYSVRKWS